MCGSFAASPARLQLRVRGAVQGVGFRPFVYRLATDLHLAGTVMNDTSGVTIDLEGPPAALRDLLERLPREHPPMAVIHSLESDWLSPIGYSELVIQGSDDGGNKSASLLPDAATCAECHAEVLDPGNRRHRYPFTNCTNCGPRFSIIEALPYDRANTAMRGFVMCERCQAEYDDPHDRRFHAQPNACPSCGPRLALLATDGRQLAGPDAAIEAAAARIRAGEIVALKGLGGFQLLVDAHNDAAVQRLRRRKRRPSKPLAVMAPDLDHVRALCRASGPEVETLEHAQAPIVLLPRRAGATLAPSVAPDNPRVGMMIPYTPLHRLLLGELGFPVVATSGNLSDEPICTDNDEALIRLAGIADCYLLHDRPITRHVDDSVVHHVAGRLQPLRRARGRAPLPVLLRQPVPTLLAVGAHFKNTVALSIDDKVFISQHIGDMETAEASAAFRSVIGDFIDMYESAPRAIVHDLHPDYVSTRWAEDAANGSAADSPGALHGVRLIAVQHHHAHLAACLADRDLHGPALGVTWDGTGYGADGTIWGGEFLRGDAHGYERVASLLPFRLPGGDAAVKRPATTAAALLWEVVGEEALTRTDLLPIDDDERRILERMLRSGLRSPQTTSAGRLFDGVAGLLGLHPRVDFEGQAAMALEFIADGAVTDAYPLPLIESTADGGAPLWLDWRPTVEAVLGQHRDGVAMEVIAARFHNALTDGVVQVALGAGQQRVALTGGCFQNVLLAERTADRLRKEGLTPLQHRQVPPNDGGVSLGQIVVAAAQLRQTQ